MSIPTPIIWKNGQLTILNQHKLPNEIDYAALETVEDVYESIVTLKVRGAPAIGITAAYGLAIASRKYKEQNIASFHLRLHEDYLYLAGSRPTAVNLFWALDRMMGKIENVESVNEAIYLLEAEAISIHQEDEASCKRIGRNALEALANVKKIMTICNAGTIATAKYGTALAPFHLGAEQGREFEVYACETRPVFQGSRLTVWELQQSGVDVTLITDSMAAHTIHAKGIEAIIVGADRIAANGDTANKIGTLNLAILAKQFGIAFYVAAPSTTFDLTIESGAEIPIEERKEEEITTFAGRRIAPEGTKVFNPAFDVTPSELITAIITEKGIIYKQDFNNISSLIGKAGEEVKS